MIALIASAYALTLDEAVKRAAEVDPNGIVAELEWKRTRLEATEAWAGLGLTPSAKLDRTWSGGSASGGESLTISVGVLDPPAWFNAAQQSAQARAAKWASNATTLDAQYAAAVLYYEALAAEAALTAAHTGEDLAKATSEAAKARVNAGLESELLGRSADIGLIQAQAATARAQADVEITRARLARALEQDIGDLAPTRPLPTPTEAGRSPWIEAAVGDKDAAKMAHLEEVAGIFPTADIGATTDLGSGDWAFFLSARWTFDGVVGPFLREREAAMDAKIADVRLGQIQRDYDRDFRTALADARAAGQIAEAARAREALAEESVRVGQARMAVGLASTLEVLRLQDEAASARADRVAADLAEATSVLAARRAAGQAF